MCFSVKGTIETNFARGGEIAINQVDDQEIAMLSLHLLQICLVYISTLMFQRILPEPDWRGRLTPTDLAV